MKRGYIIALVAFVLIIAMGYFVLFGEKKCQDSNCFSEALVKCTKASFVKDNNVTLVLYSIMGKEADKCLTKVKLVSFSKGSLSLQYMEGQSMLCSTPENTFVMPDYSLQNCHGILKESLQEETIQRMHSYIVENIGSFNESFKKFI